MPDGGRVPAGWQPRDIRQGTGGFCLGHTLLSGLGTHFGVLVMVAMARGPHLHQGSGQAGAALSVEC